MKETLLQWFAPLSENPAVKFSLAHRFVAGIFCGIVILLLLRLIWWLWVSKRSCSAIIVKRGAGDISVSIAAITGVIKHAVAEMKFLEVIRVRISRRGKFYDFDIKVRMDAANSTAPEIIETLSGVVREQMKNAFGIEGVGRIKLTIVNCDNSAPEAETEKE